MPSYFAIVVVLVLAWGTFAFGAVYDWAATPLLWASAAVGVLGFLSPGGPRGRRPNRPVLAALALVALAAVLQLAPLSPTTIARLSPATDQFLAKYDVSYALATAAAGAPASTGASVTSYRHALSINPSATWFGLACLGAFGVLLLGVSRALGRRTLRTLAVSLVFLGFAVALAGIIQSGLYSRDPNPVTKVYGFWQPLNVNSFPFGPFVNRNHFAGWMLLGLPVAIGYFCALVARGMRGVEPTFRDRVLWFSSPDASRVILVGLAVAVMALSLVLTLSRSGISGFLIALAIAAWFVLRRQSRGSKRGVALAYLALVVALALGWAGLDAIAARFSNASTDFVGTRFMAWKDAWRIVTDFPWFGTGLNTYGYATLFYQTSDLGGHFVEAHNDYVQLLAEGGLLLAIPGFAAIGLLGWEIRRRFTEQADDMMTYWLRVGATTGLVAIALQELVEFSLQIPGIAALFAVVAAIAIHKPAGRREHRPLVEDEIIEGRLETSGVDDHRGLTLVGGRR